MLYILIMKKRKATITLPEGLAKRAHENKINVSKTCADAILVAILKIERTVRKVSGE